MGENTNIQWTDHTFNPWWGCTKVSPGCDHCYAEAWAKRTGHPRLWDGPDRRTFGAKHWAEPIKWNAKSKKGDRRLRVFCASMADVFDKDGPAGARADLWDLIEDTPHLDWLVLTKRVGNVLKMVPESWRSLFPSNVWLGISVVNQDEADRDIGKLLRIPAAIHFVSFEPLLGPIKSNRSHFYCPTHDFESGFCVGGDCPDLQQPDWAIIGGESGAGARPCALGWIKDIVRQCQRTGVSVFVKQLGAKPTNREGEPCPHIHARKGDDMSEWPTELQVREWPRS